MLSRPAAATLVWRPDILNSSSVVPLVKARLSKCREDAAKEPLKRWRTNDA